MKYTIPRIGVVATALCFAFLGASVPMHAARATPIPDLETCDSDGTMVTTYACTCTSGSKTSPVIDSVFTAQMCNDTCYNSFYQDGTYNMSCTATSTINKSISLTYTMNEGAIVVPDGTTPDAPEEKEPTFTVPLLNIQIPGFEKFDTPTKSADGSVVSVNFLATYINAIYAWALGAGALVAVVMMMLGGLQYVLSRGKSKYIEKAKTRITNAITGLVLLLAAYNIAFLIDPNTTILKSLSVQYVPYIFISTEDTTSDVTSLALPDPSGGTNGVPYFSQRGYTNIYGASCKGSPTIESSGCGPTSAAMVLNFYGVQTDPVSVAKSFESGGFRVCGSGTAYAAFSDSAIIKNNDMVAENVAISNHEKIESYLKENKPILISVGKSRFTNGGHFMVLTGINSDGDFMLNDPNSGYKTATKAEIYAAIKFATYIHKK